MKVTVGRIWEAASDEKSRPHLAAVFFDAEKATLTATNSYIAARVPCEVEDGDESGLIPAAAVKATIVGKKRLSLHVADGAATLQLPDGVRVWNLLPTGKFPDMIDSIFARALETDVQFGINTKLLAQVARALGHDQAAIHPVSPLAPIRVAPEASGAQGVVMPVRLSGTSRTIEAIKARDAIDNDDAVIAAARAAIAAIEKRRGKKRAAQAFRDALAGAAGERSAA